MGISDGERCKRLAIAAARSVFRDGWSHQDLVQEAFAIAWGYKQKHGYWIPLRFLRIRMIDAAGKEFRAACTLQLKLLRQDSWEEPENFEDYRHSFGYALAQAIAKLPPDQRGLIRQHYFEARQLKAIAIDRGIDVRRISEQKHEALSHIRILLAGAGSDRRAAIRAIPKEKLEAAIQDFDERGKNFLREVWGGEPLEQARKNQKISHIASKNLATVALLRERHAV